MRFVALTIGLAAVSFAADSANWVTTWGTATLKATPPVAGAPQKGAPTAAQMVLRGFNDQSVRMVVPVTVAGSKARVEFTNAFGEKALTIGSARVALREKDSAVKPGSDRALTFAGKPTVVIPQGGTVVSDAVDMAVPALGDLLVSIYLPSDTGVPTLHQTGLHNTYILKGDQTSKPNFDGADTTLSWYFLSAVHVQAAKDVAAIVAFGDSITDGAVSTPNTDSSWPSQLARRIAADSKLKGKFAVVNKGISGNRVLRDGAGPNALARFDRDVLSVNGAKWLIVLEGINDIGQGTRNNPAPGTEPVTAEDIIAGHRQLIDRAHLHGLKVMGGTLTPYEGAAYASEKGEAVRTAVNNWIRTSGAYDAVVDFEAAVRDATNPKKARAEFNPGDNLHFNDAGYKAMANAINLAAFK